MATSLAVVVSFTRHPSTRKLIVEVADVTDHDNLTNAGWPMKRFVASAAVLNASSTNNSRLKPSVKSPMWLVVPVAVAPFTVIASDSTSTVDGYSQMNVIAVLTGAKSRIRNAWQALFELTN